LSTTLRELAQTEIQEIIPGKAAVFKPDDTVSRVLGMLKETGAYESAVVSDGPVGIVTVRDFLDADQPARTKIDGIWRATSTLSPGDDVLTLSEALVRNNIRAMPVVDGGDVVSLASQIDVVTAMTGVEELGDHPAKELVRSPVWSLDIDERIAYIRRLMLERGISHFPVVEYGRLVGVITAAAIVHSFITPASKTTTGERVGKRTPRFPGQAIAIMDTRPCIIQQDASVLDAVKGLVEQGKSACFVTDLDRRILGMLTPRELMVPILRLRAPPELPVYIIGLEDEDFFESAAAEEKIRRVVARARRFRPDITEVSVRIKRSQLRGERTRYEVTGRALGAEGQVNAEAGGWDLLEVFDELASTLGKAMQRSKPETPGRQRRRRSRR